MVIIPFVFEHKTEMVLTYSTRIEDANVAPMTPVNNALKQNSLVLELSLLFRVVVAEAVTLLVEVFDELLLDEVGVAGMVPTTLVRVIVAEGTPPEVERSEGNTLVVLMTEKFASKIWNVPLRLFTSPSTGVDEC